MMSNTSGGGVIRKDDSTLINAVSSHIASNVNLSDQVANEFFFHKFNTDSCRLMSSFRITPPPEVFDIILKSDFWPADLLVREYIPRQSTQPPTELSASKNLLNSCNSNTSSNTSNTKLSVYYQNTSRIRGKIKDLYS